MKTLGNVLVVAAHPDDEVLGCGGSMAKWSKLGYKVNVIILSEGSTSRDKNRNRKNHKEYLYELSNCARNASQILGVQSVELLDYPDNRMDKVDLLDIVKTVEAFIEKLKPKIVVTHHSGDLNIDHQIIHQAVMTACRPLPGQTVKRILSFEVPSSTEWQSPNLNNYFIPNWFENITLELNLKIEALKAYSCEMREWPHARSIKAVENLAYWRGASIGYGSAEAFNLIRNIEN
jgi:LmbE family N-acetylglucosaminyl deacetylase